MYCGCNTSLKLIFDATLSDETKMKLWVFITEPGGSVTDERLWKLGWPQSPKHLEKLLKVKLTGMLMSLRHWFCYRTKKLQFYKRCQKMLGVASFRPSTSGFPVSPFHYMIMCSLMSAYSNRNCGQYWRQLLFFKFIACPAWNTSHEIYFHSFWTII